MTKTTVEHFCDMEGCGDKITSYHVQVPGIFRSKFEPRDVVYLNEFVKTRQDRESHLCARCHVNVLRRMIQKLEEA